jgi:hypothetical protein
LDGAISCNFTSKVGAHELRVWDDADPAEIESIGILAGGIGRVLMVLAICMPDASVVEEFETVVGKGVGCAAQGCGKLRAASAVTVVEAIVLAAAVVEESKEADDGDIGSCTCRQQEAIAFDAPPMVRTMNGITRRMELPGDELPKKVKIIVHANSDWLGLFVVAVMPGVVIHEKHCLLQSLAAKEQMSCL